MKTYAVCIGSYPSCDPDRITDCILRALESIKIPKPVSGKVVLKPNPIMAHPRIVNRHIRPFSAKGTTRHA